MTAIASSSKYVIAAALGAAVIVIATNWVTTLEASPSHPRVAAQFRSITYNQVVDRSGKGDRLDFVAPATPGRVPAGCDAPFSPLARLSPSNVAGRCLT